MLGGRQRILRVILRVGGLLTYIAPINNGENMGTGTKKKILIVEDETQISRFLQLELEHENYD